MSAPTERILITGTNRGIGLELVRQYLEHTSAHLFAATRAPEQADTLQAIAARHADRVTVIGMEVTDEAQVQAAAQQIAAQVDGLDILINNAGMNPPDDAQEIGRLNTDVFLRTLHVNTVAPALITQAFLPLLKKGRHPRVVNISSEMGSIEDRTYGGSHAYCASKAALNMVSRGFAADLRGHRITVIALDPGWVQTDMGGRGATLTPSESARGILNVVSKLTLQQTGSYLDWNGRKLPW